jgi:hypothetical protein
LRSPYAATVVQGPSSALFRTEVDGSSIEAWCTWTAESTEAAGCTVMVDGSENTVLTTELPVTTASLGSTTTGAPEASQTPSESGPSSTGVPSRSNGPSGTSKTTTRPSSSANPSASAESDEDGSASRVTASIGAFAAVVASYLLL